jgi:hypothetical protein
VRRRRETHWAKKVVVVGYGTLHFLALYVGRGRRIE